MHSTYWEIYLCWKVANTNNGRFFRTQKSFVVLASHPYIEGGKIYLGGAWTSAPAVPSMCDAVPFFCIFMVTTFIHLNRMFELRKLLILKNFRRLLWKRTDMSISANMEMTVSWQKNPKQIKEVGGFIVSWYVLIFFAILKSVFFIMQKS